MKDEFKGKTIGGFIRLRSKMYSVLWDDGKECNTEKRVNIELLHLTNSKTVCSTRK